MSAMMFRANLLPLVLPTDSVAFRICADYPMYTLAHLIGGTIIIDANLSLYRLHGQTVTAISRGWAANYPGWLTTVP